MYSIRLGFKTAERRMNRLIDNGHHSEAIVTIVATTEKTFRRILKQLVVSAGFESKEADKLLKSFQGWSKISRVWPRFDPGHRGLPQLVGNQNWQALQEAQSSRNDLIHGTNVFSTARSRDIAVAALAALVEARQLLEQTYGYDGWERVKVRRVSQLHGDPKVRMPEERGDA